jgi:hypothetical protein
MDQQQLDAPVMTAIPTGFLVESPLESALALQS